MSYVCLEYEGDKRYLISRLGSNIAEVHSEGDTLVVRGELSEALANAAYVRCVIESQYCVSEAVLDDTLYNWHIRFGY